MLESKGVCFDEKTLLWLAWTRYAASEEGIPLMQVGNIVTCVTVENGLLYMPGSANGRSRFDESTLTKADSACFSR